MIYDVDYFIAKFEAIPEDEWCECELDNGRGAHCALGHTGTMAHFDEEGGLDRYTYTDEAKALIELFSGKPVEESDYTSGCPVTDVNDFIRYGDHPRERILKRLYQIKAEKSK